MERKIKYKKAWVSKPLGVVLQLGSLYPLGKALGAFSERDTLSFFIFIFVGLFLLYVGGRTKNREGYMKTKQM